VIERRSKRLGTTRSRPPVRRCRWRTVSDSHRLSECPTIRYPHQRRGRSCNPARTPGSLSDGVPIGGSADVRTATTKHGYSVMSSRFRQRQDGPSGPRQQCTRCSRSSARGAATRCCWTPCRSFSRSRRSDSRSGSNDQRCTSAPAGARTPRCARTWVSPAEGLGRSADGAGRRRLGSSVCR
jgi:hypothetical protein